RFEEPLGGLGPRATPSIAGDKVVALGAEGWLRCLEAATGKELWQIDLRKEANCAIPMWGFSCSPFCTEDIAIVHSGASGDKGIMAFRLKNGELAWSAAAGKMSYGSLQSVPLLGQDWIGLLSEKGAEFFDPADGTSTFLYEWPHSGYRALQPQMVAKDQFLVPTGQGTGTQLVRIQKNGDNYEGEEVWTNWRFRPDYNDVFVHQDNIYGFDGQIFASIRLEDGKQNWKGGRYGKGQAVLLADSNAILVLSEEGEMILLSATPEDHVELYKQKVLPSRTWNHPVIVGDRLYVRDAEEAACYALPVAAMPNTPDESEAPEPEAGAGEPSN
ncbi:MAG: PQQ-binding-like beta-propeller repeat protein, partial [Planctomycetota bacterium]